MMSPLRTGRFTSSEIVALTGYGSRPMTEDELKEWKKDNPKSQKKNTEDGFSDAGLTYIEETNMERRLGRPLENETDAKATSWGLLLEPYSFSKLGLEYTLCSKKTFPHPTIEFLVGSPDALKGKDTVADHKNPMTLKSFCQLVDPYIENGVEKFPALSIEAVRANHKDGDKYFYQIVSNAMITDCNKGELIVFVPYKSELETIRGLASSAGEMGDYVKWIYYATDEQLPHLIDGGHYKNLNIISFDITDAHKNFLYKRVKEAGLLLNPWK